MGRYEFINFHVREHHAEIVLNRPQALNALTFPMIAEIKDAIDQVRASSNMRSLVLRGEGRSFCSGDDIKSMGDPPFEPFDATRRHLDVGYLGVMQKLRELPMPVIVGIHGYALGAGCEFGLAGDIRILTEDVKVGLPFVRLTLSGGTYNLPRIVGVTKAVDMLFTGRNIDAREALDCGYATKLVKDTEELKEAIARYTDMFAKLPTKSIAYMKQAVYRAYESTLAQGMELQGRNFLLCTLTEDFAEMRSAREEGREPKYQGR